MKYPIFIHQTSEHTVLAMCPILKDFYGEGDSIETALKQLNEKFVCFLHDDNIELEIIPVGDSTKKDEEVYNVSKDS